MRDPLGHPTSPRDFPGTPPQTPRVPRCPTPDTPLTAQPPSRRSMSRPGSPTTPPPPFPPPPLPPFLPPLPLLPPPPNPAAAPLRGGASSRAPRHTIGPRGRSHAPSNAPDVGAVSRHGSFWTLPRRQAPPPPRPVRPMGTRCSDPLHPIKAEPRASAGGRSQWEAEEQREGRD